MVTVVVALDLAERKAGIEPHGDRDRVGRRLDGGVEHRRRDAVAIGDGIADLAPAASGHFRRLRHRRRHVAGRDHEGHAQR
jgi:hypothetical protein